MTVGPSASLANSLLDAIGNATAFSVPGGVFVQLHVGDPGAAGTANKDTNNLVRKAVSFGAAAAGSMANDVAITWAGVATNDPTDDTHYSLWDNVTDGAGTFLYSGVITANPVSDGDTLTFAIGQFVLSFPIAA